MTKKSLYALSLGCPKNRVDVESVVALVNKKGWDLCQDLSEADALLVATCGFITKASEESIETIFELAAAKKEGAHLVVAGCLPQRYGQQLATAMEEVDAFFVGTSDLSLVADAIVRGKGERVQVRGPSADITTAPGRNPSQNPGWAYLKVSDGCSRKCGFCTIPSIRGPFRSRRVDEICDEARELAKKGVLEINLVAQDLTSFGRDRQGGASAGDLLSALGRVDGIRWIRPMYVYPDPSMESLLGLIGQGKVVPYLDMPVQHSSDRVLKRMKRGATAKLTRKLISMVRQQNPEVFLRTTLIVGHPGEDKAAFQDLEGFVRWARFEHLGAFRFSPEEGTPSALLEEKVSKRDSYNRYRKILAIQRKVSRGRCKGLLGKTLDVLVEGPSQDSELVYVGRHSGQAPEIDGLVYLDQRVEPGAMVKVHITQGSDYDLFGHVVG